MAGPSQAATLLTNATATGLYVSYSGGRTALVIAASAYGTTVNLQLLAPDGTTNITMNASTINANSAVAYDLPAGQYRIFCSGGTTTAMYAKLVSIPY